MSLKRRVDKLEGDSPEEHCRFAFVAIDFDGTVMNWPSYDDPEEITAEEFETLREEHEKTCPICRKLKAQGRYPPDVNFMPYEPNEDESR